MKIFCLFIFFLLIPLRTVSACGSCALPNLDSDAKSDVHTNGHVWSFETSVESRNWDVIPAEAAHGLHDEGHHVHDKTHEETVHLGLTIHPSERITFYADLPYAERHFLEVHEHDALGEKRVSEGFGDLQTIITAKLFLARNASAGLIGGVKWPTGRTSEKDDNGDLFEAELQPGSGSYDFPTGVFFQRTTGAWEWEGTLVYLWKSEGTQDFRAGDTLEMALSAGHSWETKGGSVALGAEGVFEYEQKDEENGAQVEDSGGTAFLIGPSVSVMFPNCVELFAKILLPAYQDPGGVHQKVDFEWEAGARLNW